MKISLSYSVYARVQDVAGGDGDHGVSPNNFLRGDKVMKFACI